MHIAVLGGGMQGCCTALALAARGVRVTLFERSPKLLSEAAANNEGKIHLGYVYAGDRSFATARTMIRGALAFHPFLSSFLEDERAFSKSSPFVYGVHRESQVSTEDVARHFEAVHAELGRAASIDETRYFGVRLHKPTPLKRAALERDFDTRLVKAAFMTPEIAVNPRRLTDAVRVRVESDERIEVRLRSTVLDVEGGEPPYRVSTHRGDPSEPFDHVVNALWGGRLAVDAKRGLLPKNPWLHRVKYGFCFRAPAMNVSTTIVLGPYGDTVAYGDGERYLSWYPVGLKGIGGGIEPPVVRLSEEELVRVRDASFEGMAQAVPACRVTPEERLAAAPRGGVITALAHTDIDDPKSGLHSRYEIGVSSYGGYHSIDTGKFTMAPYFAQLCADRILGPMS